MKVIVLDDDGTELYAVDKGFMVISEDKGTRTRLTLDCTQYELSEFMLRIMNEIYLSVPEEKIDDVIFLNAMAEMANHTVSRNKKEEQ